MSWRTVVISKRCKLDYGMNYMIVRGEDTKRVLLDEIAILIIEDNSVSMTAYLMTELINKKIKVIFCDSKRNPHSELVPYYGAHNDSLKIKSQFLWSEDIKLDVWTRIVREKISNQAKVLRNNECLDESKLLFNYVNELQDGDISNREGHAAKVYFNAIFGMDFTRSDEVNAINSALDYGYSIILSAINREVVSNGYLTQLGLGHDNQFNHFNLSCDLMEPYRVLVDMEVLKLGVTEFGVEQKRTLVNVVNSSVVIRDTEQTVLNAIKIYVKSVFDAINEGNLELIKFFEL